MVEILPLALVRRWWALYYILFLILAARALAALTFPFPELIMSWALWSSSSKAIWAFLLSGDFFQAAVAPGPLWLLWKLTLQD